MVSAGNKAKRLSSVNHTTKKKKKKKIHHHHFTKFIAGHIKTMKGVFTNVRSKRRLCLILRYSTSFDVI